MFTFHPFKFIKSFIAFIRREYEGIKALVEDKL